jgi:hypothetical protein
MMFSMFVEIVAFFEDAIVLFADMLMYVYVCSRYRY